MNEFNADLLAASLLRNMVSDFRVLHGQSFASNAINCFESGIKEFRDYNWPRLGVMEPARFKAWWQLRHLLKAHRFADDKYSDEELEARTIRKYLDFQVAVKPLDQNNPVVFRVLQEARRIAREILGEFDPDAIIDHARFGKRSSIGASFKNAYIDYKLTVPTAFTSTEKAREWFFKNYLPNDPVLQRIVKKLFRTKKKTGTAFNFACSSLNLVNVPKSWKTLRTITPLSLLELFYTFGVGGVIETRLAEYGLSIRKLQPVHRVLAERGSSGSLKIATADLSAASDSLTSQLLCCVLPRRWYNALKSAFSRQVMVGDKRYYTHTVLPMGNGFTFPVETLIFYCLIKAVGNLARIGGVYSVYGDDLIYPVRLHRYIQDVFPRLGLTLNVEKSYADSFFRESCGGDYYRGCDVRPYIFKGGSQTMSRSRYLCLLYKVHNGLRARWEVEELPNTFRALLNEIVHVGGRVLQVPPSYPAYAGVRTSRVEPGSWLVPFALPKQREWHPPFVCKGDWRDGHGTGVFVFQHLHERPKKRVVLCTEPYYWATYRGSTGADQDEHWLDDDLDPVQRSLQDRALKPVRNLYGSQLKDYLKSFAHYASKDEFSRPMLDYVRRKGGGLDPCSAVHGETMVSKVSSVVTYWA